MRRLVMFAASGAGLGYIPIASGTWGSLLGPPVFWLVAGWQLSVPTTLIAYAAAVLAATWIAGRAEEILAEHDSHVIVIDEIVGYLAATLFLAPTWENTLIAFAAFRAFDIVKPFPAGSIDRSLGGGAGVVLDDVAAGIYANLATRAVLALVS